MKISCEYGGKICKPDAFNVKYTDDGSCFIFNWDMNQSLIAQDIGSNFGLRVTLNIEQYEYMPGDYTVSSMDVWDRASGALADAPGFSLKS